MSATPLIPFEAGSTPSAGQIANDHSLLNIDQELDFLLERIEDEIEENGEASKESMDRLRAFAAAVNVKVDRIGRYLLVMEARAAHCKREAARYATRAKRAESKIERTKQMVLYYLESHNLTQLETDDTTLRRQRNSQDSVIVKDSESLPPDLKRYELKVEGELWLRIFGALTEDLAASLRAAVKKTEPSSTAIKERVASGRTIEGVEVKRLCHLRVS